MRKSQRIVLVLKKVKKGVRGLRGLKKVSEAEEVNSEIWTWQRPFFKVL